VVVKSMVVVWSPDDDGDVVVVGSIVSVWSCVVIVESQLVLLVLVILMILLVLVVMVFVMKSTMVVRSRSVLLGWWYPC
jgi:hypothetical protein